ncbi:molybdenum ABC transporter ATP-binding protein [Ahniella affigens]|uniref:Molybdenum ABC transporter ATP-binding protein n=1 Tax=Ahniella affigens TaxID=2021234 RepID=A0A2P1PYN0_9GAMM|nr:ATP-binding cassette domain-containing protein [Ahniella affigens]AVP99948.1 molybdenum ABC transporter ATP-binding protein [Ahniella affigens]
MFDLDIRLQLGRFERELIVQSDAPVLALTGYSGSGKTSVLNAVAGLIRPTRGHIRIGSRLLFDASQGIDVPVHQRRIGFVFQDARLFPHYSVRDNLLYGQRGAVVAKAARFQLDPLVELLGLEALLPRRPVNLSGGEAQRVAIGRALLAQPDILLLDEPLSALDRTRRERLLTFFETLRDQFRLPIIYVSHAADEVRRLTTAIHEFDS